MLSHKQRNDWCTVVNAHLGKQIDVEIVNNNSFHLMRLSMQVADVHVASTLVMIQLASTT